MADSENENPESHDFINVDKPEAEVSAPELTEPEQEPQPQVSSTTEDMDSSQPEAEETFEKQEKDDAPEESPKETSDAEEKPASEPDSTSPTRELTSFPARWMKENNVDKRVIDLIYWKCAKKTGVVFATVLVVLISLSMYSLLSVITFFSMAVLTVALLYRVGKTVMGAIQKSGTDHPFKTLLEKDIEISKEKASECVEVVVAHINCAAKDLRKLFLVEDIVDSIKFGVGLWVLSYVGAWFSMLTLLIIATILAFALPRVYEDHQDKIDEVLKTVHKQVKSIMEQAKSKLPERLRPKEKTT